MNYTILQGDNRQTLKTLADNSIDAIVTDPPYGIDFLGKAWDANTGALETYQECLRVLKPGGHILAFSAARTYHHLAVTLEAAGFEIRDQIMWIYSSGFPKSQDVGKSIERSEKKTKEKIVKTLPSNDSVTVEFRPKNVCVNCDKTNNGSNHLKCDKEPCGMRQLMSPADNEWNGWGTQLKPAHEPICVARKPIKTSIVKNVQKYGVGALNIDATRVEVADQKKDISSNIPQGRFPSNVIGEIEGYQKYFYCPKVSRKERHIGYEMPPAMFGNMKGAFDDNGQRYAVDLDKHTGNVGNNHPTVKPIELMKYLIKLVTPAGGTVLDPFNGSGSTGCAAVELGYTYIGCELDLAYVEISKRRIEAWVNQA